MCMQNCAISSYSTHSKQSNPLGNQSIKKTIITSESGTNFFKNHTNYLLNLIGHSLTPQI